MLKNLRLVDGDLYPGLSLLCGLEWSNSVQAGERQLKTSPNLGWLHADMTFNFTMQNIAVICSIKVQNRKEQLNIKHTNTVWDVPGSEGTFIDFFMKSLFKRVRVYQK